MSKRDKKDSGQNPKETKEVAQIYEENIAALMQRDPHLATKVASIIPNTRFEVYMGEDVANFNIYDKELETSIFKSVPLEESMDKLKAFEPFMLYPYLYFYGLGNGIFYTMLLSNEKIKRVIVIEPNLEVIFIVLNIMDLVDDILSNRLVILHDIDCTPYLAGSFFANHSVSIYSKLYNLDIFNSYYDNYGDSIVEVNKLFVNAIEHAVVSVGNDTKDAIIGIKHHIENLPLALHNPSLVEMIEALRTRAKGVNDTAIIVSTGPSLKKQLPLLKEIAPYATLVCIDASFPILAHHGIVPDIVVSIERVKESARFYTDTPHAAQEGVLFAISSIVHEDMLHALKGSRIQISFRPFGYTNFYGLHKYGYIGIGMSAANMAYEIVVHSVFKHCIFIGQDLAFGADGTSHCSGAVYGANEIKKKLDEKYYVKAYGGCGMVETTNIWKLFLTFFEKDIAETPYNIDAINATEGGARIHGTRELSFKDAIKDIVREVKPKLVLKNPTKKQIDENMAQAREKTEELIAIGAKYKKRIEAVFLKLTKTLEKIEELNKDKRLEEIDFKKLDALSSEIDEVKEAFMDKEFCDCFLDAIQSYIFHQELNIAKIVTRQVSDEMGLKAKQIDYLYAHKYWLFSLAGGITCVMDVARAAMDSWDK